MQTKIKLYESKELPCHVYEGCEEVVLECMIHNTSPELTVVPRAAVVVFPGGGYQFVSDREAEPIASAYYAAGYNCFILRYVVGKNAAKNKPLIDAAAALAHIRINAEQYHVDPEKVAVIGFSAGGHLSGYIATSWHLPFLSEALGLDNKLFRPDAAMLGYPVISAFTMPHYGSFDNLLGNDRTEEDTRNASLEFLVTEKTPPCFIWHTFEDDAVPVQNSIVFAKALSDKKIPYELHIFPMGRHGLSRANRETSPDWSHGEYDIPYVARWMDWSIKWLEKCLFNK